MDFNSCKSFGDISLFCAMKTAVKTNKILFLLHFEILKVDLYTNLQMVVRCLSSGYIIGKSQYHSYSSWTTFWKSAWQVTSDSDLLISSLLYTNTWGNYLYWQVLNALANIFNNEHQMEVSIYLFCIEIM